MNDVLQTISNRYSCRAFRPTPLEENTLQHIANAAIASPSGLNRQAWRVIVVTQKELLDELETEAMCQLAQMEDNSAYQRIMTRGGKVLYQASALIMVPIDSAQLPGAIMDCGILCQTVALAATSLGVDNVICGLAGLAFAGEKAAYFKQKLGFPQGYEFGCSILLGYHEKATAPHQPDSGKISYI